MSKTPEQLAREVIDQLLSLAGWVLQDREKFDRNAAEGVAVREFALPNGECDYLLFVGGKADGTLEAKRLDQRSAVLRCSRRSTSSNFQSIWLVGQISSPFTMNSTGAETYFCDRRDTQARSRSVFAFHTPGTLHAWLKDSETLRFRLRLCSAHLSKGLGLTTSARENELGITRKVFEFFELREDLTGEVNGMWLAVLELPSGISHSHESKLTHSQRTWNSSDLRTSVRRMMCSASLNCPRMFDWWSPVDST